MSKFIPRSALIREKNRQQIRKIRTKKEQDRKDKENFSKLAVNSILNEVKK